MSSLAMTGVTNGFSASVDSRGYMTETNDLSELEVMSDENFGTADPSEFASPLGSASSKYSQRTTRESTSATQGSSALVSEAASGLGLDDPDCFLALRLKKFMEASRPGLIWSDGKFDLLLAAQHADHLLLLLDDTLRQLLEAQRKLSGMKESARPKMKLLNDWACILMEGISTLDCPKGQKKYIQEHLSGRLGVLAADLSETCRLLMTLSVNARIADHLLLGVIKEHRDKFNGKEIESTINVQKFKPISTRFKRLPVLRPLGMPGHGSSEVIFTANSTPTDGLLLQEFGIESNGSTQFSSLDYKVKLTLINAFFREIHTDIIQAAYGILDENTQILAPIRSSAKKFGQPMSLEMKSTSNGLEKHILNINRLLEESDASYWDKTLGYVIIQYLTDIRQRMLQVVHLADLTSQELDVFQNSIEKMDKEIGDHLGGKQKYKSKSGDRISVNFPVSMGLGSLLTETYLKPNVPGTSESLLWDENVLSSNASMKKASSMKISMGDQEPIPILSRWGKFKRWFTWKKTNSAGVTVTVDTKSTQ